MCLFSAPKPQAKTETPPPPREPDPDRVSGNIATEEQRRRARAFNTGATTLTSPLGVSNYGSASTGVTLLGRA